MVIEVVLGEIREHSASKAAPRHPLLCQGMGTDFHRRQLASSRCRLRQLGLQAIGKRRGVSSGDAVARPPIHEGAKQRGGSPAGQGQMFDQIGGGGFSIRPGHTQQRHALTRSVPERRRQLTKRAGHWIGHHHNLIAIPGWIRGSSSRTNHRRRGTSV